MLYIPHACIAEVHSLFYVQLLLCMKIDFLLHVPSTPHITNLAPNKICCLYPGYWSFFFLQQQRLHFKIFYLSHFHVVKEEPSIL